MVRRCGPSLLATLRRFRRTQKRPFAVDLCFATLSNFLSTPNSWTPLSSLSPVSRLSPSRSVVHSCSHPEPSGLCVRNSSPYTFAA